MKTVPLKSVLMLTPDGVEIPMTYWGQLQSIMRTPINVQQGAEIDEIRKSIRVMDVLDKVGSEAESVDLEDTDYEYMVSKVTAARFTFVATELEDFVDDVTKVGEE